MSKHCQKIWQNACFIIVIVISGLTGVIHADVPLFIFAGQSNMVGYLTNVEDLSETDKALQPGVMFFGPNNQGNKWDEIDLGKQCTQITETISGKGFGPEAAVGRTLIASGRFLKVAEVKYAINGGPGISILASPEEGIAGHFLAQIIRPWDPGTRSRDVNIVSLYANLLDRVEAARVAYTEAYGEKTHIAGFFWMQGESDSLNPYTAEIYGQNLNRFIFCLRRDLKTPDMPFIYGRIRDALVSDGSSEHVFPGASTIRAKQAQLVDPKNSLFLPNVRMVDTDTFEIKAGDRVHFSSKGVLQLGEAMARAFLALSPNANSK